MSEPILLVRPFPLREEGPQGYLLRLAEANFLTVRDLEQLDVCFDLANLQRNQLMPDPALDPQLHAHVERINAQADKVGRSWNRQQARWCVHCLGESPIWQASWELLFHDACPQHGVWLVDRCSSCGSPVSWNRQQLMRCPCGADLRAEVTRACPDSVRRLSAVLAASLLARPLDDASEIPVLRGMSVVDIQRLIRFLGSYLDPAAGSKPLKRYRAGRMDVSWPVTSIAAEILQDWPNAFHTSLSRLGSLKGVGSRVRRSDIDLFNQNYIFGREIAAILGRSSRKVMMMLAEHGIYPARGQSTEPCRQLVYSRRDEIQRFLSQVTGSPPETFALVRSAGPSDSSE